MKRQTWVLILVAALAACGADPLDLPREGDIVQRAEVCIEIGEVLCLAFAECGQVGDRGECETVFFESCCQDAALCGQQIQMKKDLAPCVSTIDGLSCSELAEPGLPISCQGLN